MSKSLETVERERERERAISREISFVKLAQNTVFIGTKRIINKILKLKNINKNNKEEKEEMREKQLKLKNINKNNKEEKEEMREKQKAKARGKLKHNFKREIRRQKGITLIALIITIVILIILATITINIAFGENGLIKRAEQARDLSEQTTSDEEEQLNSVTEYLDEKLNGTKAEDTEVYVTLYTDGTLGFSNDESKIEGLTPLEGKNWNITDSIFSIDWNADIATTPWFNDSETITKVVFMNKIVPKSVTGLFMECTELKEIEGIENLDTSKVTSMEGLFLYCSSLTSLDVSNFNTSNVTNMYSMFAGCSSLENLKLGKNFNTSKATNMGFMFWNCEKLTSIDVSNFNTSGVTSMYEMFGLCSNLTSLDLSSFNTSEVTEMNYMFENCSRLTEILVGPNWTDTNANKEGMFENCGVDHVTLKTIE